MPASRGGYPFPVTFQRRNGYRCTGVPPSASKIVMANGQLPTDSFSARRREQFPARASGACPTRSEGRPKQQPATSLDRRGLLQDPGVTARWQYLVTGDPSNSSADSDKQQSGWVAISRAPLAAAATSTRAFNRRWGLKSALKRQRSPSAVLPGSSTYAALAASWTSYRCGGSN